MVSDNEWDGLRDRGWLSENMGTLGSQADGVLGSLGLNNSGLNSQNFLSASDKAKLLDMAKDDLTWTDKFRGIFGFKPKDSDGDSVPDSYEKAHGLNPDSKDSDLDGLHDGVELLRGTDPLNPDSDGDGVLDGRDAYPMDSTRSVFESDIDTDGDGVGDRFENALGTNPYSADTDGDGILDGADPFPLDATNTAHGSSLSDLISPSQSGLELHVQNTVLSFFTNIFSVLIIFALVITIFVFFLWYWEMRKASDHYYHIFSKAPHYRGYDPKKVSVLDRVATFLFAKKARKARPSSPEHYHVPTKVAEELNRPLESRESDLTEVIVPKKIEDPTVQDYIMNPRWAIVEDYLSEKHEALWRIGILEADNMLDEVLKERGYEGYNLGDRLQQADFDSIQLAWDAHKIRNRIAHEGSKFTLTEREARRTFALYKAVFKDLNVLTQYD